MRITEDTFKRFRRNEINFVKCLKELLHIAWYDNNKTLNTIDGKNFEISFRNKNEFDYALDRTISNLERIGAKRIKSNRALGRITFLMPDSAKENIINMFTAKEDEREKAYKDSIESADISKYYPSDEVLNKIRGYRDRGSRINVRAMNNLDKILTYYYACILLDWERVAGELSDQAMDVAIHKEDVKNILNAIYEKTEAQETDERDALAKKENLPKNDLIQFSDKIRRQQGTWLPKSILKFFIDNNIPVRLDGRSYGGDYDRNGVQWSERENFTVYPGTDHEIKDSIVVNTLESGGPTKYSYSRAGIRVGVQKVLDALADRYLREGFNESVNSVAIRNALSGNKSSDRAKELKLLLKNAESGDTISDKNILGKDINYTKTNNGNWKDNVSGKEVSEADVIKNLSSYHFDKNKFTLSKKNKYRYSSISDRKDESVMNRRNRKLTENDEGYRLGKWLGARLLTGWTAMLNVDGAEESPYYDEYDQLFDGTFVQCLNKLKEYQDIIDRDGVPAYLALQSSHGEYFDGDYDTIIDKLYDRGYLYEDDMDESLNESKNTSLEEIKEYFDSLSDSRNLPDYSEWSLKELTEYYTKLIKMLKECKRRVKEINAQVDEEGTRHIAFSIADALASHGYNYDYYDFNDSFDSFADAVNSIYDNFDKDTIQACIDDLTDEIEDIKSDPAYGGKPFPARPLRKKRSDYADWKKFRKFEESMNESVYKYINKSLKESVDTKGICGERVEFKSGEEMLDAINSGSDFYNVNTGDYVFGYNDNGSIAVYYLDLDEATDLQNKCGGDYWGGYLGPGGYIYDDESYEGRNEYAPTNKEFCDDNYANDGWVELDYSCGGIDESLNENCNSYSYKGKTIIDAGDYWFVKGYEEKFPTSDEAEEFIDDKKKDEGVNINIRESLNKMDAESDNTYDLLNLYESKNLSRKQKKDIARMIYENYGLERIYNYLYEATEESEDELPVEDRVKELTNDFKNTNGSYVFEDGQDANKAVSILKSRGYEASQKRTQDGKYRVTADKKNK